MIYKANAESIENEWDWDTTLANNAIDIAHAQLAPLPFESCLVDDCMKRGISLQEGGAIYNFTGPQGFGIANMADSLYAIKKLVFEEKKFNQGKIPSAIKIYVKEK